MKKKSTIALMGILAIIATIFTVSCDKTTIGDIIADDVDAIYFVGDSLKLLETVSIPLNIELTSIQSGNSSQITLGGTAVRGEDYTISDDDLNVTFAEGVYTTTVAVTLIDNAVTEGERILTLSLPIDQGLGVNNKREFNIIILDDDEPFGTVVSQLAFDSEGESDSAEEGITGGSTPGDMDLGSSDLEFGEIEGSTRGIEMVGIRFNDLNIPRGVNIENATIQFFVDEDVDNPAPVIMEVYAEDVDNATTFEDIPFNMSSRPRTTALVEWGIPVWTTIHEAGPDQRTVDLGPIIKEIIDRPGWQAGNSINFIFIPNEATLSNSEESGRVAESNDDEYSPVLTVDWVR